jgi:hypothetical protein
MVEALIAVCLGLGSVLLIAGLLQIWKSGEAWIVAKLSQPRNEDWTGENGSRRW